MICSHLAGLELLHSQSPLVLTLVPVDTASVPATPAGSEEEGEDEVNYKG